MKHHTNFMSGS